MFAVSLEPLIRIAGGRGDRAGAEIEPARSASTPSVPSANVHLRMDLARLRRAVEAADLRCLLMVVVHLSGDRRWLAPPYRPERDVRLISSEDAGLPVEIQRQVRAAAVELLARPARPAISDPGDELMLEMMRACLGERVPPEYAPMMREEMGFVSRGIGWTDGRHAAAAERRVLIVGAGASGILLGARLEQLGIPYVIVERNDRVGGTWWENQYPGCGVDTPNHAYSYSFGTRYPWARYFSSRDQIHDYLERCSEEFGVRRHVRFGTTVTRGDWDEGESRWRVALSSGDGAEETLSADFLVSAIGQFGLPQVPRIDGLESFSGESFHTTAWPRDLDLRGKRVAIVGTGASCMQIVPSIVDDVASLAVYQRSPQWARPIPRYHDPIGDDAQWLLATVPFYAAWFRFTMLWRYGDGLLQFLEKDPDWPHPDRSLNRVNDRHRREMTDHILAELGDRTDLVEKCLPDYPPYGKRILLDNGWYQAIRKPNAELVTDAILRVDRTGVVTEDGRHREADVLVLATGFEMTRMAARLNLHGRGGVALADVWANENPTAYLGITVSGFPNLFVMQGPNTGLGHGGSAIFQSECQARYATGLVVQAIERGLRALDVRPDVQEEYVRRVDERHERLIWTHPGMSTYYRNRFGRVMSVSPWRLVDYWRMTHEPSLDDYETS